MSQDAKNSILLWVGTLVFFGLFWAAVHYEIGPEIPRSWQVPLLFLLIGLNVAKAAWTFIRNRKSSVR